MNLQKELWFVLVHKKETEDIFIAGVDHVKDAALSNATKNLQATDASLDLSEWEFEAVQAMQDIEVFKSGMRAAFKKFGVPDGEMEGLIKEFAKQSMEMLNENNPENN